MTIFSAALLLFLVMDPFGNVSLFLAVLNPIAPERRRRVIVRELLIALLFLIVFLFAGHYLLEAIGISESILTIAGGIILFLIALRIIFPPAGGAFAVGCGGRGKRTAPCATSRSLCRWALRSGIGALYHER